MEVEGNGKSESDDQNRRPATWREAGSIKGSARRSSRGNWTEEEDDLLRDAVQRFNGKDWKKIADCVPGRTDVQCLHRWRKVLNPDVFKGPWTKEEDDLITELVHKHGHRKWSEVAKFLPGRIGNQCRERWYNHLNPEINRDPWTREEESILIEAQSNYGNRWVEIAKLLHGSVHFKSENAIKNHWHCSLRKKLDQGVHHSEDSEDSQHFSSYRGLCYEPPRVILRVPDSPEFILKRAAMSFQNIPSIIRRPKDRKNAIDSASSKK